MKKLGIIVDNDTVKWIPGHENRYAARIDGEIISYMQSSPKILSQSYHEKGYKKINLSTHDGIVKTMRSHRLIAFTFVHNPEPEFFDQVDHIDSNRENNSYTNLRWCNCTMNHHYAYKKIHGEDWKPEVRRTRDEIEQRKLDIAKRKQEKRDAMPYGSIEEMIKQTARPVLVNGIEYRSAREAAKYICSDDSIVASIETMKKEIQRFINGKRKAWRYKDKYNIGF